MDNENENVDEPLFAAVPDDLGALSDDELAALIESYDKAIADVTANPADFLSSDFTTDALFAETKDAYATRRALKEHQAQRTAQPELSDEDRAAFAKLAADDEATDEVEETEPETVEEAAAVEGTETTEVEPEPVVAAGKPARRRAPAPSASRELPETQSQSATKEIALVASGGAPDMVPGEQFSSELDVAQAMIRRWKAFGDSGPGVQEKFKIMRADWTDAYPRDHVLGQSIEDNYEMIRDATRPGTIMAEFTRRRRAQIEGAPSDLVASGGLCAPVTPYYNLQYISVPTRPVMSALPSFNADRGGLRYARPAALSAVTTAVGLITESEDAAGGTSATKTCQVIPCPDFQETDVDIIYHCLQFGNLGARTFPELVAQWNNLVLAAHARLAESNLLTQIDAFSTQVVAGNMGLGASATLFSQLLTAAAGLRSRNRMDPNAVLRLLIPWWAPALIVSDVIRGQFQRFDTDTDRVTALLRSFNIEPTYYIDSANGRGQVYGTQSAGDLLTFPSTVMMYLFPEASFLYLDGGTLELGIVRDSVLNKTNDFQIFGETFENVAYVGVESLAIESVVCDTGTVSLPAAVAACTYGT
jgi:hypothetical protein